MKNTILIMVVTAAMVIITAGCETGRRAEKADKNIVADVAEESGGECEYSFDCPAEDELCKDGACVNVDEMKETEEADKEIETETETLPSIVFETSSLKEAVCYKEYKESLSLKTNWKGGFDATVTGLPSGFKHEIKDNKISIHSTGPAGDCAVENSYNIFVHVCLKTKPDVCADGSYTLKIPKLEPLTIDGTANCIFTANHGGSCALTAGGGSGEYEWAVTENSDSLRDFEFEGMGKDCKIYGVSSKNKGEQEVINVTLKDKKSGIELTKNIEIKIQETFGIAVSGKEKVANAWSSKQELVANEKKVSILVDNKTTRDEVKLHIIGGFEDGDYTWTVEDTDESEVALYHYGVKSNVHSKYPSNEAGVTFENKAYAFLHPADSYDGSQITVTVKVSEAGTNARSAVVNFTNLKFEQYLCATEPKLTVNGVTAGDADVIELSKAYKPGQEIKLKSDDPFVITSVITSSLYYGTGEKGYDYQQKLLDDDGESETGSDIEFSNDNNQNISAPYLGKDDKTSFEITTDPQDNTCNFPEKTYTIKYNVKYPSYDEDILRHFIIDLGQIIETGKESYFKISIFDSNNSEVAYSKNIHLQNAGLDNKRVEVINWQKNGDSKWQALDKIKIKLGNISKIKLNIHDECVYYCMADLDITINEVLLLGKYYFAYLTPQHHAEVKGENNNYFACFKNISDENCSKKFTPKDEIKYDNQNKNTSESNFWFRRMAADDCPAYFWDGTCYEPEIVTDGNSSASTRACKAGYDVGGGAGCVLNGAIEYLTDLL